MITYEISIVGLLLSKLINTIYVNSERFVLIENVISPYVYMNNNIVLQSIHYVNTKNTEDEFNTYINIYDPLSMAFSSKDKYQILTSMKPSSIEYLLDSVDIKYHKNECGIDMEEYTKFITCEDCNLKHHISGIYNINLILTKRNKTQTDFNNLFTFFMEDRNGRHIFTKMAYNIDYAENNQNCKTYTHYDITAIETENDQEDIQ